MVSRKLVVELSGTPSSGKDTIIKRVYQSERYAPLNIVDESVLQCPIKNNSLELEILWTVFDTYSTVNRVLVGKDSSPISLTIFNRGLFDRIAFARLLRIENAKYAAIAEDIETWLKDNKLLYECKVIFLFLTSYEKAIIRKKQFKLSEDSKFQIVNPKVIEKLNDIYLSLYDELKNDLHIIKIDDLSQDLDLDQKFFIVTSYLEKLLYTKNL